MTKGVYGERMRMFLHFFMENVSTIINTKKKKLYKRVFIFLSRKKALKLFYANHTQTFWFKKEPRTVAHTCNPGT